MINVEQVTARLILDEDEVLHAYQDHLGFWTIGVGHLIDKRKGGGISQQVSRYILSDDIRGKVNECAERFDWFAGLNEARRNVIVCMAFQLGVDGVSEFKLMIRAICHQDWVAASLEMCDSDWHKQTPARCERMAKIMLRGVWE